MYSSDDLFKMFLNENSTTTASSKRQVLVFHCEFSSERGPKLSRLLRNQDRQMHRLEYPRLKHPEIYVLEGGYKAFYEKFEASLGCSTRTSTHLAWFDMQDLDRKSVV